MSEKNDYPLLPSSPSRRRFLKAAAATAGAIALTPQETLAKAAEIYEQTSDFFNKEVADTLKKGNKANFALGTFLINGAEETDHFLSTDAITSSLKEVPVISTNNGSDLQKTKTIQNPLIIEQEGIPYMTYYSKTDNKIMAIPLTEYNWTYISKMNPEKTVLFDKDHQDIFQTTKLTSAGLALTNLKPDLQEEMFCRDGNNELVMVMRQVEPKTETTK